MSSYLLCLNHDWIRCRKILIENFRKNVLHVQRISSGKSFRKRKNPKAEPCVTLEKLLSKGKICHLIPLFDGNYSGSSLIASRNYRLVHKTFVPRFIKSLRNICKNCPNIMRWIWITRWLSFVNSWKWLIYTRVFLVESQIGI